jgi:hypothetical protein
MAQQFPRDAHGPWSAAGGIHGQSHALAAK